MLLEWYRRRDAKMSEELKNRLFTEGSIVAQEQAGKAEGEDGGSPSETSGSLGIGSLKGGQGL